jgi:hypothetical protein
MGTSHIHVLVPSIFTAAGYVDKAWKIPNHSLIVVEARDFLFSRASRGAVESTSLLFKGTRKIFLLS